MKIAIVGTGYVGLSNAVILAQHHEVWALDLDAEKVAKVNSRISPIEDAELEDYLANRPLNLTATPDKHAAYDGASFVVIATPTDYDERTNYFNTRSVESVIEGKRDTVPQAGTFVEPVCRCIETDAEQHSCEREQKYTILAIRRQREGDDADPDQCSHRHAQHEAR